MLYAVLPPSGHPDVRIWAAGCPGTRRNTAGTVHAMALGFLKMAV